LTCGGGLRKAGGVRGASDATLETAPFILEVVQLANIMAVAKTKIMRMEASLKKFRCGDCLIYSQSRRSHPTSYPVRAIGTNWPVKALLPQGSKSLKSAFYCTQMYLNSLLFLRCTQQKIEETPKNALPHAPKWGEGGYMRKRLVVLLPNNR
jgi:hypothetical protein